MQSNMHLSFSQGNAIESEHLSELTEEEYEAQIYQRQDLKGFLWLDAKYLNPFFTRRLTQEVRLVITFLTYYSSYKA